MNRRAFITLLGSAMAWPLWQARSSQSCRPLAFSARAHLWGGRNGPPL
jgi:hypothetical protein